MNVTAIIVAGGLGRRMGGAIPKQFVTVLGKPLLAHTLIPFESVQEIGEIILIVPRDWEEHCRSKVLGPYGFKKVSKVIPGGKERQDSVWSGVKEAQGDAEVILVHDGVRPLISEHLIRASVQAAARYGAAIVAIPLKDTLKEVSPEEQVKGTLKREGLWLAQTPQTFRRDIIVKAYESAYQDRFYGTDDAALVERMGAPVKVVPGLTMNIKVTTPEDLRLAEAFLKSVH